VGPVIAALESEEMTGSSYVRSALLIAAAAAVLVLERSRRARPYVERPSTHVGRNLLVAGLAATTVHLCETPVVVPIARTVTRRGWGLTSMIGGHPGLRDVVAIVLLDYTLYVWHILVHRLPWLWRFHLVHHVDLDLDASTGLRFHAGELVASIPWRAVQIIAIGVTPRALAVWQSLTIGSVLFHHSNTALSDRGERLLSWIVATPRMHAIHHSIDPVQLHSNFSSGLAIWDRLHGTARFDDRASDVTVGVLGYLDAGAVTLIRILGLPFFRRDRRLKLSPPDSTLPSV
jgi:sterol desaturase/sphingolipid hydroxylase (fatty acid hydroxylase superfamily)